uniref:Secreted protein n=1 Tax=Panstrongylus lignarius TaxID=156445 RepID=A0A224XYA7_9HEMI
MIHLLICVCLTLSSVGIGLNGSLLELNQLLKFFSVKCQVYLGIFQVSVGILMISLFQGIQKRIMTKR